MGAVSVRDLAASANIQQVTISDLDEQRAAQLAREIGQPNRISAKFADIDDKKSLIKILKEHDVVINGSPYIKNVAVMEAALEAGVHYLDLGGLYHETRRQLKLHRDFERANLLAVLGIGGSPGITNVMARYAADRLESLEKIEIRVGSVMAGESINPLPLPYSPATILDEFTKAPVLFTNGKFVEVAPLSGDEIINFQEPVGAVSAVYALHSEIATLPIVFSNKNIQEVSFKVAFPEVVVERLKTLITLGLTSEEPVQLNGNSITPRQVLNKILERLPKDPKPPASYGVIRVDVYGKVALASLKYRLELFRSPRPEYPGMSPTGLTTGLPPSIVAQMIVAGEIEARGALAPESCVDPERFFAELALRGFSVTIQKDESASKSKKSTNNKPD